MAILFSPLLSLIAVLVMANKAVPAPTPVYIAQPPQPLDPRQPCARCGEQIPLAARVCRFCQAVVPA
jgi:hypothetical protein